MYTSTWSNELLITFKTKLLTTVLMLLQDRFLSNIILAVFGFFLFDSTALAVLSTSHIYLSYKKFYEVTLCKTWDFIVMLIWGKTKPYIKNWQQ